MEAGSDQGAAVAAFDPGQAEGEADAVGPAADVRGAVGAEDEDVVGGGGQEGEEIVGAAVYLASDASGFATGTTVTVDGGISA